VRYNCECTALFLAASYGHLECVKLLIDYYCDVNVRNTYGSTALIKQFCDVNISNSIGDTALTFAVSNGHLEYVKLLSDNHCDINVRNSN
jgi:ankyrin repeat protein